MKVERKQPANRGTFWLKRTFGGLLLLLELAAVSAFGTKLAKGNADNEVRDVK